MSDTNKLAWLTVVIFAALILTQLINYTAILKTNVEVYHKVLDSRMELSKQIDEVYSNLAGRMYNEYIDLRDEIHEGKVK